jgi:hypothetical protein
MNPLAWPGEVWSTKPVMPLPVLGAPGFYEDGRVFRPRRPLVRDAPAGTRDLPATLLNSPPGP